MKTGMRKMHPSFGGSTPKGKGGSRPLDGPGTGRAPGAGNMTKCPDTSPGSGKMPKTMGGMERKKCKDPGVKCYAQGPQGKHSGGY